MDFRFNFDLSGTGSEVPTSLESNPRDVQQEVISPNRGEPAAMKPFRLFEFQQLMEKMGTLTDAGLKVTDVQLPSAHLPFFQVVVSSGDSAGNFGADDAVSDLVPRVYEGGFKVWECTMDMVEFLETKHGDQQAAFFENKTVLDLGCGVGVLGFYAWKLGASFVCFQDYNDDVIASAMGPSVLCNLARVLRCDVDSEAVEHAALCSLETLGVGNLPKVDMPGLSSVGEKFCMCSGDWSHMEQGFRDAEKFRTYDVILTTETIYSRSCYSRLHDVLEAFLVPGGVVYLGAKVYYFGVGGGVETWCDYIKSRGIFNIVAVHDIKIGLRRTIIEMKKR